MVSDQNMISELITEARADEVGLWLIIAKLRDACGITEPTKLRAATLDFVCKFLDSGQVVAGYYRPDGSGIAIWDMPTGDVISRISDEWHGLGREPNIGDIVIFVGKPRA
jgi:hypothetical protein